VVVSPRCPIAATDGALAVVNVVRQSWDYNGDCAAVAAGTDGSGFVSHVVRVCLALGFERELASGNVESFCQWASCLLSLHGTFFSAMIFWAQSKVGEVPGTSSHPITDCGGTV
jgi:hypothetical protein